MKRWYFFLPEEGRIVEEGLKKIPSRHCWEYYLGDEPLCTFPLHLGMGKNRRKVAKGIVLDYGREIAHDLKGARRVCPYPRPKERKKI